MYFEKLRCLGCDAEYGPDEDLLLCPQCNKLLDPRYDLVRLKKDWGMLGIDARPNSIWKWKELLPVRDYSKIITMGEGGAPMFECRELARELGVKQVYIMNDAGQPTGSLKDRSIAVTATKAIEFGYKVLSCDSTGNKAASTAGYAAKAGLKSIVFCPYETPLPKLAQALFYGAVMIRVKSDYSTMNAMYRKMIASRKFHWYDCGTDNPYRYEGKKTYAYEIAWNMGWKTPTHVFQPAAGGMSVVKAWKGFGELAELGLVDSLPAMVACQASQCGPIAAAFEAGLKSVPAVTKKPTVASAIAVANPGLLGNATLDAVYASNGAAVACDDGKILATWKKLGGLGVFCEPSSAVSIASMFALAEQGKLKSSDVLVGVLTGTGFKDMDSLLSSVTVSDEAVEGEDEFFAHLEKVNAAIQKSL